MPKTPSKMHMYDMVKIDTIVFEIVGGGGGIKAPPPGWIVSCLYYPGSNRVNSKPIIVSSIKTIKIINIFSNYTLNHTKLYCFLRITLLTHIQ